MTRHFVFSGLSATGKTTIVNRIGNSGLAITVPEHNDWIGGSHNFPKSPNTVNEKKEKQDFFLNIDLNRYKWAKDSIPSKKIIISDSDFTSTLAHNYAERWLYPHLDIYEWLVEKYCCLLEDELLKPADLYFFLDSTLTERKARRAIQYQQRKRNDIFFSGRFPNDMRRFYWILMHSDSPRSVLPCLWLSYHDDIDIEEKQIREKITYWLSRKPPQINISQLVSVLRSTINDRPEDVDNS
jgi:hypothetical protein